MKEAKEFFEKFREGMLGGLYTAAVAKVEKYDPKGKADITVLPDGDLVGDVPVATLQGAGYFIRCPLKKGDIVVVVFASRSIDSAMHDDPEADDDRMHDLNDAIIVGGLNTFAAPLPAENAEDLIIGKTDRKSRVVISKNGDVTVEASGKIFLGDGATQGLPLGQQLKTWIDNHVHSSSGAGKPTTASPDPSGKVFTK